MKGRNTSEKHSKYLQDLYNKSCDENYSLKSLLNSTVKENDENKKLLSDFVNINEKLKKEVIELERKLKLSDICRRCVEFDDVSKRMCNLEKCLDEVQSNKTSLEALVLEKENEILTLNQKVHDYKYLCSISECWY